MVNVSVTNFGWLYTYILETCKHATCHDYRVHNKGNMAQTRFFYHRGKWSRSEWPNVGWLHIPFPRGISMLSLMTLWLIVKAIWPRLGFYIIWVKGQGQSDIILVDCTSPSQDASACKYFTTLVNAKWFWQGFDNTRAKGQGQSELILIGCTSLSEKYQYAQFYDLRAYS